jgi:DGQHR domain-containing protein
LICSCCGYKILGEPHPIEGGKKYVCDRCWNNPDLFFPEKVQDDDRLKLLYEITKEMTRQTGSLRVKVIKLVQKDIEMYVGKMKSREILQLFEIDKFKEEELQGYQRELYEERTSDLIEYLVNCPVAVIPGLFVSLREAQFVPENGDLGTLEIPRKRGSIWIIDGQHRMGGFEKLREWFIFARHSKIYPELFLSLMNYELPVVFIDSRKAAEKISDLTKRKKAMVTPEDLERVIFFIVNKTQRGISPSLKDALLYRIKMGGIEGLPILRKESWRIHAAFIGISLSQDKDSPLSDKINISGKRGTGKPIQLNSFISSLRPLFADDDFLELSDNERLEFIKTFWKILKGMFPEAFKEKSWKEYMLLKAIGLYCLNRLAYDIFKVCLKYGYPYNHEETLQRLLEPLKSFDWKSRTSPLSALGGMKGVRKAYELLTEFTKLRETKSLF